MRFNKGEMVNFLEFLEEKYPNEFETLESFTKSVPPAINKKDILPLVFFFWEGKYINASPIEENGKIVDFKYIRINSNGIEYLLNLKKLKT